MANSVDLVIGSEAIRQVENLISKLSIADAELLKISQSASAASKGITGISTPSGLDKAVSNTSALNAQLERQNVIITKLHADIAKKAEQSRLAEIKLQQQREKAFDSFEKNAQKEAVLAEKTASAYNKTQSQINNLTKVYNDLSVRKERYNNLSANEEMRLNTLQRVTEKYNGVLKTTDATIGKNQRNVGNYASGYNALGNSINQLTREAPAFANSVNTGFMAISNNIPALTDAIKGIREQNKALAAEGKPTQSVLKQLAGSLFSWQTLLSVGITLLTVYGKDIVEWTVNLVKGDNAVRSLKENQKDLNNAIKEGNKDAAKEISQLDILYKTATNTALSIEQRTKAVNKLQETYPSYFSNISDEIILNGKAYNSYIKLRDAIFDSARAKAIQTELEKRAESRLEKELELREKISITEAKLAKQRANPKAFLGGEDNAQIFSANEVTRNLGSNLTKRKKELEDFRKASLKEDNLLLDAKAKFESNSAVLEADRIKLTEKTAKKQKQLKREDIDGIEQVLKARGTLLEELDKQIASLQTENILNGNNAEAHAKTTEELNKLLEVRRNLNALPVAPVLDIKTPATPEQIEQVKTLTKEVQNYLNSFSSEFMSNAGFTETFDLLNGNIEDFGDNFAVTFNAIAESAQEAFNFISNASQANFDKEYERLENQKEVSLRFAGDSSSAIAKIEEDAEKRKKEIAKREFKAKQKQALFNIAIDTAQAIVSTYAQVPKFDFGVSATALAFIIGGIGLAQSALVATQQVPQYWEGTDNHTGGLMLVNDGKGSNFQEKVILPNGKEIMPEGRNVLMNAPKGTKVLTHEQQIQQMLNERGVSMSANFAKNNGMTAQEMDSIMEKHFANIQTSHISIDKSGFNEWNERNGNRTRRNENRVSRTGFRV